MNFKFPLHDDIKLRSFLEGFNKHSGGVMKGCVMAVDGLTVKVRQPYISGK